MELSDDLEIDRVDSIKVFTLKNIATVRTKPPLHNTVYITKTTESNDSHIFIIDTGFIPAFGHWVYESVIYIPTYKRLKEKYPTLKLMVGQFKPYKELYTRYYGIESSDILYEIIPGSTCLIPSPICCLSRKDISNEHRLLLDGLAPPYIPCTKDGFTFFPRQETYNYEGNNDKVIGFDSIIHFMERTGIPYSVYHTTAVRDLSDQIEKIQKSRVIIIPDGSAFLVNGIYATNSIIYVVGRLCSKDQAMIYPQIAHILQRIESKNTLYFFETDADCIEYLLTGIYTEPSTILKETMTLERWW
jgi:hypothetical protein